MQITSVIVAKNIEFTIPGRYRVHEGGLTHIYFKPPIAPNSMYGGKALVVLRGTAADAGNHGLGFRVICPDGSTGSSATAPFAIPAKLETPIAMPLSPNAPYYHERELLLVPGTDD